MKIPDYPKLIPKEILEKDEIGIDPRRLMMLNLHTQDKTVAATIRNSDDAKVAWVDYTGQFLDNAIKLNPMFDYVLGKDECGNPLIVPLVRSEEI